MNYEIEHDSEHEQDCSCCGNTSHTIFGYVHADESTLAAFCVKWTDGHELDNPPWFLLSMGAWGDGSTGEERVTAGCILIQTDEGPRFSVVDSSSVEWRSPDLVGRHLTRDQVMGGELAAHFFNLLDQITLGSEQIGSLVGRVHA